MRIRAGERERAESGAGSRGARRVRVARTGPQGGAGGLLPAEFRHLFRPARDTLVDRFSERLRTLLVRRAAAPAGPPPDPVVVLRSIIEPADGVDLATVELLADDEGVEAGVVHATLARLRENGTVRYERGSDGEEVYAWARPDLVP